MWCLHSHTKGRLGENGIADITKNCSMMIGNMYIQLELVSSRAAGKVRFKYALYVSMEYGTQVMVIEVVQSVSYIHELE
jgi:hypothetical protein